MTPLTLKYKIAIARAAARASQAIGRGGTSIPGLVLNKLDPRAIGRLAQTLPEGNVVVSATNGKTTIAAMVSSILTGCGKSPVHNRTGANMSGGIASTLADAVGRTQSGPARVNGDIGLFEVDEFWLAQIARQLQPKALLLANLFRDQLDRYGEVEIIADRWKSFIAEEYKGQLVLNADDPMIASLADKTHSSRSPLFFGVEGIFSTDDDRQHASDFSRCRRCNTSLIYENIYLAHLGDWRCPQCSFSRPQPDIIGKNIKLKGASSSEFTLITPDGEAQLSLPLPGLYNVYNAVSAAALCTSLGVGIEDIAAGLTSMTAAFGRAESLIVKDRPVSLLLIKNPTGANEVLRTLTNTEDRLDLLVILNDKIADGRDVSWIWDADWEILADKVRSVVCSGTRAPELALRLQYAGIDSEKVQIVRAVPNALAVALESDSAGVFNRRDRPGELNEGEYQATDRPLYVLPTYTAMLELQGILRSLGATTKYWNRRDDGQNKPRTDDQSDQHHNPVVSS